MSEGPAGQCKEAECSSISQNNLEVNGTPATGTVVRLILGHVAFELWTLVPHIRT